MAMVQVRYEELAGIQHGVDAHVPPGYRVEILGGRVVVNPPPLSYPHNRVAEVVGRTLESMVSENLVVSWAPHGVWLTDDDAAEYQIPDVVVYERAAQRKARLVGSDVAVVVEVISPSNRRDADYEQLVADRATRYGIDLVLIADPDAGRLGWWRAGSPDAGPGWATGLAWSSLEI